MNFEEFLEEWRDERDFITVQTSGSTGKPKVIRLPKEFVRESAKRTNSFFSITEGSRLHSCVGADFIGGKMMAVRADLANGVFSYETASNKPLKDFTPENSFDLVAVVPSQTLFILDKLSEMPKIKSLLIGGSSIHSELRKRIAKSSLNAYESYGMTETASHIALRKIEETLSPFHLLGEIQISVDKENCLKIKFPDGTDIQTNDIAEIISENEFFILGRRDNIIISGGKKISPELIEEKISSLITEPYCITGFPDEKWGERVILLIEKSAYSNGSIRLPDKENLKKFLNPWEMPKEIFVVDSLPKTDNGKIKRPKDSRNLAFVAPDSNLFS